MRFSAYPWSEKDMIGGNPALDFVNTVSGWGGSEPVDRLGLEDFAGWVALAGVAGPAGAEAIRKAVDADPEAAQKFYARAHALRAALWRIFSRIAAEEEIAAADLEILTEWTRRAARLSALIPSEGGFKRAWTSEAGALERPVLAIAQAAEHLLEEGPLDRLHACGGNSCEWLFVDLSKNGKRRWCSMATCGNDAKVKKFRKRKKDAA